MPRRPPVISGSTLWILRFQINEALREISDYIEEIYGIDEKQFKIHNNVNANGFTIINLPTPTRDDDAVPKEYVDTIPSFGTISVANQPDVVADGAGDTLTFINGTNITISTDADNDSIKFDVAGFAPIDAQYLVLTADALLTNERVFTIGHGLDGTDAGAGSTYTVDVDETELDHGLIGGLTDDDHIGYFRLLGRSGGQVAYGGIAGGETLTLRPNPVTLTDTVNVIGKFGASCSIIDPTGNFSAQNLVSTVTATAADYASIYRGLLFSAESKGAKDHTVGCFALDCTAYHSGAGLQASLTGARYAVGLIGTGNATYMYGSRVIPYHTGTAGTTVGLTCGIFSGNPTPSTVWGVPETSYGVWIEESTQVCGNTKVGLLVGKRSGAATSNFAISTLGGWCRFQAGDTTEVPVIIRGVGAFAANFLELQSSLAVNVAEFDSAGQLGIGVDPAALVHVLKSEANAEIIIDTYKDSPGGSALRFRRTLDDVASPDPVLITNCLGKILADGWRSDAAWSADCAGIYFYAAEDFVAGGWGSNISFETTKATTTTPRAVVRISDWGNLLVGTTADPVFMEGGIACKTTAGAATVIADAAALYTGDARGVAGKSWWHAMGEDDVEHLLLGLRWEATTGHPTTKHEGTVEANYEDDKLNIYVYEEWREIPYADKYVPLCFDDVPLCFDDEMLYA